MNKVTGFFTSSIQRKMLSSFGLVIALILIMVLRGHLQLVEVEDVSNRIIPNSAQMGLLQDFALSVSSLDANLDRLFVIGGAQFQEDIRQNLEGMATSLESMKQNVEQSSPEMKALWNDLETSTLKLQEEIDPLVRAESADLTSREMNKRILSTYAQMDEIKQTHQDLTAATLDWLRSTALTQQTIIRRVNFQFVALGLGICALAVFLTIVVTRNITLSLAGLVKAANRIVEGDLEAQAPVISRDEVGQLAIVFNQMTAQLRDLIADLEQRMIEQQQAEGERDRLQQEVIEAQRQAIRDLSSPVIPVMDRIIVMPLIGNIDTMRARDITRSLLDGISAHQANVVILDITGVSIIDSGVASHLNKTIQAARLKGAHTIVTGISDAVAETIVDLGIDWSNITTLSNLQTGLVFALNRLGFKLAK